MGFSESSVIDMITVLLDGQIQIRKATLILKDDVEIAKTYHRSVIRSRDELIGQDERVVAIANAAWQFGEPPSDGGVFTDETNE